MEKDIFENKKEFLQDIWELEERQARKEKFENVLKLYSLFGLLIALFGVAYFLLSTFEFNLNPDQQIALMIAGVGVTLSILSWVLLTIRKQRVYAEQERIHLSSDFAELLWKWNLFEESARRKLNKNNIEFNKFSIREVIDLLIKNEIINANEAISLKEIMKSRNMTVHSGHILPKEILSQYLETLDSIISKIEIESASNNANQADG